MLNQTPLFMIAWEDRYIAKITCNMPQHANPCLDTVCGAGCWKKDMRSLNMERDQQIDIPHGWSNMYVVDLYGALALRAGWWGWCWTPPLCETKNQMVTATKLPDHQPDLVL